MAPCDEKDDEIAETLDARGYRCPVPVIRIEAVLRKMAPGARLKVIADDPVASVDIPHFCRQGGHVCVRLEARDAAGGASKKREKSAACNDLVEGGAERSETGADRDCVFLVTRGEKP